MIQSKHCNLCEHPKRNLKNGLTCGLTDEKPIFKVSCSDIKFSNSFKEYIPELTGEIELLKKKRTSVYLNFTLLGGIGLIVIFGSYSRLEQTFETELSHSSWIYFTGTLLIYIVGTLLISMGFLPLSKLIKAMKKLKSEKRELNEVLSNYELDIESILKQ